MARESYRVDWYAGEVDDLADTAAAAALAYDAGRDLARLAQALAVRDTGEGAASIRPWPGRDTLGPFVDIGWDRDHFYMGFHEWGTQHHARQPALGPALDRYVHL